MNEQPPAINPSPKTRFQTVSGNIKSHREWLDRIETQRAFDFAVLEYNRMLCESSVDANGGAANHFKSRGALEFMHVLKNLSENPTLPRRTDEDNLKHNLK